jgi:hypothetical protein
MISSAASGQVVDQPGQLIFKTGARCVRSKIPTFQNTHDYDHG